MSETKKPEISYRAGGVKATVWKNNVETKGRDVEVFNVTLTRSYKDKKDEWQESNSYGVADIAKAQLVLGKAYEFISLAKDKE